MAAIDQIVIPSLTFEEILSNGSTLSNPAADGRRLFLGEDGLLHLRDSAGAVTTVGGAGGGFDPDTNMPWRIDVNPIIGGHANTNWASIVGAGNQYGAFTRQSTGAQNADISFNVVLAAGTWTFRLHHYKHSIVGIYTVAFDGSSVGTIDGYNATESVNAVSDITGIVVAATGKIVLKLTMATKNASASSYYGFVSGMSLLRTA